MRRHNEERPQKQSRWKTGAVKMLRVVNRLIAAAVAFSILAVLCLRWWPPPTSAFMVQKYIKGLLDREKKIDIHYRWVDWKLISPAIKLAVVAAEDQKFMNHRGFDFKSISDVVTKKKKRGRLRGASTISQQVAKNLFLWPGRNYLRKGIEAYFTVLLELLWSKKRILEVYLNIVEFGDGVYGVQAASQKLIGKRSAQALTREDAALLAAVLPNPRRLKARNPSAYVLQRMHWIGRQMALLSGITELNPAMLK